LIAAKLYPRDRRGVAHLPSRLRGALATRQRAQPMKQFDVEYLDLNYLDSALDPTISIR
jgi:hypothetical protein